jgi:hypothetical protein
LIADGVRLVVLGPHEQLAALPELSAWKDGGRIDRLAKSLDYAPETKLLVVAEETVLADPDAALVGGSQLIRVFANAIYHVTAKRPVDPNWEKRGRAVQQYELRVQRLDTRFDERLAQLYESAMSAGKWKGASACHDRVAYWAAGVCAYFDAAGQDAAPNDFQRPISDRETLQRYDPDLYELVHTTMAYEGHVDWRVRSR